MYVIDQILHDQPYNERDAEALVNEYMRVHHQRVRKLVALGEDCDDIQQELRIALWKAWTAWDGRIALRRWLSWKLDFKLRDLERAVLKKRRLRYPLHTLKD